MYISIDLIRALATCLITNSHFTPIYTFDMLARGGAFGNSLFFLATGFCLYNCSEKFTSWYTKRLIRLYIPVLIIAFFNLYNGNSVFETVFFSFAFPANYWFVCALVVLYPVYYFVVNHPFKNRKYVCTAILILAYVIIYIFLDKSIYTIESIGVYGIRFSYIFSFFLMLFGAYVRKNYDILKRNLANRKYIIIVVFSTSFVSYFAFLLLMNRFAFLCKFQFMETVLCITTTVALFILFLLMEDYLTKSKNSFIIRVSRFIGNCTLEIYLVQTPLIKLIGEWQVSSAIKFLAAIVSIVFSAIALKYLSNFASGIVYKAK